MATQNFSPDKQADFYQVAASTALIGIDRMPAVYAGFLD
jgi:hypothetical protein